MTSLFGTDGIRGKAGEFPLDTSTLIGLGRAIVTYLLRRSPTKKPRLVVAQDTRISGVMIEALLNEVLVAQGGEVYRLGILPTPAVPILMQTFDADLGLMITASHNPYWDNGIKIFNSQGLKLSDEDELEVSELTLQGPVVGYRIQSQTPLSSIQCFDGAREYQVALHRTVQAPTDFSKLKLVVDCAHGASSHLAHDIFDSFGIATTLLANAPDGTNINHQCGALHPENLGRSVLRQRADLGLALDGDGDRCVLVDELGEIVTGDEILGICALDLHERGLLGNVVVSTVLANIGLEMTLFERGVSLVRTPVGDRNVISEMLRRSAILGGESSGHFIFLRHCLTGDGILSCLQIVDTMSRKGKSLSELRKSIRLLPQVMVNVPVKRKDPFSHHHEILEVISSVESALESRGRVLVRYSGTESVARVMLEGEDGNQIRMFCNDIVSTISRCLSD